MNVGEDCLPMLHHPNRDVTHVADNPLKSVCVCVSASLLNHQLAIDIGNQRSDYSNGMRKQNSFDRTGELVVMATAPDNVVFSNEEKSSPGDDVLALSSLRSMITFPTLFLYREALRN
eukprot:2955229-Amphidinium_carterae.1